MTDYFLQCAAILCQRWEQCLYWPRTVPCSDGHVGAPSKGKWASGASKTWETWNDRMVKVGRNHWSPSSSCLSRVPMSMELRIVSRQLWNVSRWNSTPSLGSLFHYSSCSGRTCSGSVSVCSLVLLLGTTEKNLVPSSWPPSFRYLCTWVRSSPSRPQTKQAQLPQLFLIREMLLSSFPTYSFQPQIFFVSVTPELSVPSLYFVCLIGFLFSQLFQSLLGIK